MSSDGFGVRLIALFSDDVDPILFVSLQFNRFSISFFLLELCSVSMPALFARSLLLGLRGGSSLLLSAFMRSSFLFVLVSGFASISAFVFSFSDVDGFLCSEALSDASVSSFTFVSLASSNSSKLWLRLPMLDGSGGRRAVIAEADARRVLFSLVFIATFCNGCIRPPLGSPLIHLRFGLVAFVNFDGDDDDDDDAVTPFCSGRPSSQSEFFSLSESLLCILWYINGFCRTVVEAVLGVLGVASPRMPGR